MNTSMEPNIGHNIVDANIGITNIIAHSDIEGLMMQTFSELEDVLTDHCGPYGKFAMIKDQLDPTAEPVFTKDGINIVRSIEYISPMQNFVRSTIAYIGSRIDMIAGDGTTSSMIIAVAALRSLIKNIKEAGVHFSYKELTDGYDNFLNMVEDKYKHHVWTIDRLAKEARISRNKAIKKIAAAQSYTSSHGDEEISNVVAKLFSSLPQEAWNYINVSRERYETEKRVELKYDYSDFSLDRISILHPAMLNSEVDTCYKSNDATLLIVNGPIADTTLVYQDLLERINKITIDDPDLVVICMGCDSNMSTNLINMLHKKDIMKKVCIFTQVNETRRMEMRALAILANEGRSAFPPAVNYCVKEHVIVDYKSDGTLSFHKLYQIESNDMITHPWYDDPTRVAYHDFLSMINRFIEIESKEPPSRLREDGIMEAKKLYNKMLLQEKVTVRIGGLAHDNAAILDVLTDCLKASKISLTKGFVFGGNKTLYTVLKEIYDEISHLKANPVVFFVKAFMDAITVTESALFKYTNISFDNMTEDEKNKLLTGSYDIITKFSTTSMLDLLHHPVVIQTATIDQNILRRFGEVALKFINTVRIITIGGIYLGDKNKENIKKISQSELREKEA